VNDGDLAGKRVLVVGGETELGRAIGIGLAEAGVDVAIASLTPDTDAEFAINSALNELWALDRNGVALPIEASDADALRGALEQAESEIGALHLVVLVGDRPVREAVAGRPVFEVEDTGDPADALMTISERLSG